MSALMERLDALARFSDEEGALTRLYLTPSHRAAAEAVRGWMEEAGMTAAIDAAGSVAGRWEGRVAGLPALLLGSHIDTVRDAGRYDGNFGVLAAIEAVRRLRAEGVGLPFAVEVLAFGDEEGARFPVTLTTSRAIAGTFDPATLAAVDPAGVSLREALAGFGADPQAIPALARRREAVLGYVELHIEQGPVLEAEGLPVGVVSAIAGAARYTITLHGHAGHAGTVPMALRRDALAAAAEMMLAMERIARAGGELVATVGQIEARPGAVNVIPGEVRFSLDLRSPSDAAREAARAAIAAEIGAIAARRAVHPAMERTYEAPAAVCSPALSGALEAAVARAGIRPRRLPSGAGHDGLAMVALCPIAMLFVRCKGGISHHPAESITAADAETAVAILGDFLRHWSPDEVSDAR